MDDARMRVKFDTGEEHRYPTNTHKLESVEQAAGESSDSSPKRKSRFSEIRRLSSGSPKTSPRKGGLLEAISLPGVSVVVDLEAWPADWSSRRRGEGVATVTGSDHARMHAMELSLEQHFRKELK
mgnify:CR=1 FL=1